MTGAYLPRVMDGAMRRALRISGAVMLEGVRACGKTRTALEAAGSSVLMDDPAARALNDLAPGQLLIGARPRLLDEWQIIPEVWDQVRRAVDRESAPGQFILTGSATPADDHTRHTGAGRFMRQRMRTLSWWEHDPGFGAVSLSGLFEGERPAGEPEALTFEEVLGRLLRPGFPAWREAPPEDAALLLRGYLDEVIRTDLLRLGGIRNSPAVVEALLTAIAASSASAVSFQTLARDLAPIAPDLSATTVSRYVDLLARIFVVERQQPWAPKLRSRARLRTSPKLHLADPALAAVALQAPLSSLQQGPATAGALFESAVHHDLTVLAIAFGGRVQHYRDSNGYEIDAVVVHPDGRWGAVEVKLVGARIANGHRALTSALEQIDGEPSFRLIVTGTGPVLTLDDGTVTCGLHRLCP